MKICINKKISCENRIEDKEQSCINKKFQKNVLNEEAFTFCFKKVNANARCFLSKGT